MSDHQIEDELADLLPDLEGFEESEVQQLLDRTGRIVELTQHPGWPVYCDYLIALTTSMQDRVLGGYCKTMEEYKELTGRVDGIRLALQAPNKLLARVDELRKQASELAEDDVEF